MRDDHALDLFLCDKQKQKTKEKSSILDGTPLIKTPITLNLIEDNPLIKPLITPNVTVVNKKTKFKDINVGDILIADAGFQCIQPGEYIVELHKGINALYISCKEGCHFLDGQTDCNGDLVGLVKKEKVLPTLMPVPYQQIVSSKVTKLKDVKVGDILIAKGHPLVRDGEHTVNKDSGGLYILDVGQVIGQAWCYYLSALVDCNGNLIGLTKKEF